jgi:hypothetical protein
MTIVRRRGGGGSRGRGRVKPEPEPDPFIEAMKEAQAMERANEYLQKLCLKAGPKN